VLVNPMREFMHGDESHVHAEFDDFKNNHGKEYATEMEHMERKHIFKHNYRYINSINRQGLSFRVAINHLADKSDEELRVLTGKQKSVKGAQNNGLPFDMSKYENKALPESFDWRLYGAVTPVKDQGVCGSCNYYCFTVVDI
jgi:C1A family cysteine protease